MSLLSKQESTSLTDLSPMPFGKHKGMPMQDVPAEYLHWWWCNGGQHDKSNPLHGYIVKSMSALESENPDLIWT